jgi:hypothetical protein
MKPSSQPSNNKEISHERSLIAFISVQYLKIISYSISEINSIDQIE